MARKSRSKWRGSFLTANRRLPLQLLTPLSVFEDRREWNPEGDNAPARSFNKSRHRLVSIPRRPRKSVAYIKPNFYTPDVVAFHAPRKVLICVRRKRRKEVMFALNKAGKAGQRSPRFNEYSEVSCRS